MVKANLQETDRFRLTAHEEKTYVVPKDIQEMSDRLDDCGLLGKLISELFIELANPEIEFSRMSKEELKEVITYTYSFMVNIQKMIELFYKQKETKQGKEIYFQTARQLQVHLEGLRIYITSIMVNTFSYSQIQNYSRKTVAMIDVMMQPNKIVSLGFYQRMGHIKSAQKNSSL